MGNLGMTEILMILVIALIIFGPRKLPELGKSLGQSLAQFRRASEDFKRQWEEEVDLERHRLNAPAPQVEPAGNIVSEAQQRGEMWDLQPGQDTTDAPAQAESAPAAETATDQTATDQTPIPISDEQTIPRETKRDWM